MLVNEASLYRITKALGSGQFGVVSMGGWQSPMGAVEVAVKQLQPGVTEAEKIRFLQEAAIIRDSSDTQMLYS